MKFATITFLLTVLAMSVMALEDTKVFVVTYPKEVSWDTIRADEQAIKDANGKITHEWKLIKGYVAEAPASYFSQLQALGAKSNAVVEEDTTVHINNDE